jgi:hypothetical protein
MCLFEAWKKADCELLLNDLVAEYSRLVELEVLQQRRGGSSAAAWLESIALEKTALKERAVKLMGRSGVLRLEQAEVETKSRLERERHEEVAAREAEEQKRNEMRVEAEASSSLADLHVAHEIAVDETFSFKENADSLGARVREAVQAAFWADVAAEVGEGRFGRLIDALGTLKDELAQLQPIGDGGAHSRLDEGLNVDHLRQMLERGAFGRRPPLLPALMPQISPHATP